MFWRDCVPTGSWEKNCYEASVNPESGSTLARRLNQSCFPAVLQSNQITIKFGTAEARRLNWASIIELITKEGIKIKRNIDKTANFNPFTLRPSYDEMICHQILWCYHSNKTLWQNFAIVLLL